jgi:hypothetical protein
VIASAWKNAIGQFPVGMIVVEIEPAAENTIQQ